MEEKLRNYIETIFEQVPPTKEAIELKEEILQNLIDKYHDLLLEGKSPDSAYNIAIVSIGNTDELLSSLRTNESASHYFTKDEISKNMQRNGILTAVAVMLYILSPVVLCITEHEKIGLITLFAFVAVATGILIFKNYTKLSYQSDETIVGDFREWKTRKDETSQSFHSIKNALWMLVVVLYLFLSFTTGHWEITWLIFLIGTAVESIIRAAMQLKKEK